MSDEKKTVELKDGELEKVSGGEIHEYGGEDSCEHIFSVGQEVYLREGTLSFYRSIIISRYGGRTDKKAKYFYPYYKIMKTYNGEYIDDVPENHLASEPHPFGTVYQ